MARTKAHTIESQVTELQKSISFLESTSDIDTAIVHYEAALKAAHTLTVAMSDRKQKVETIKQTYFRPVDTTDDTSTDAH